MTDDAELLRQYIQAGSEDAFAELVQRHLPVVYSSALRQTDGDVELAKDICQTVFIDLAGKARSIWSAGIRLGTGGCIHSSPRECSIGRFESQGRRRDRRRTLADP